MTTQQALKSSSTLEIENSYDEWKHGLAIWQIYTDLNKSK